MIQKMDIKPFLKWVGGKRQLLPQIDLFLPPTWERDKNTYFEPFIGGGAVLFHLQPDKAVINDVNSELINCYHVIQTDIEQLILTLKMHQQNHFQWEEDIKDRMEEWKSIHRSDFETEEEWIKACEEKLKAERKVHYFYQVRNWDRNGKDGKNKEGKKFPDDYSLVERAARIIYLNRTCFNGVFRENSKGEFNVPLGVYPNPKIADEENLRKVHHYLSRKHDDGSFKIQILQGDFKDAVKSAKKGDFIYLDPPYAPLSLTSSFVSYSKDGFGDDQQEKVRDLFGELMKKDCFVMESNSSAPLIYSLYEELSEEIKEEGKTVCIEAVDAKRNINANGQGRGPVKEVLIISYETQIKYGVEK